MKFFLSILSILFCLPIASVYSQDRFSGIEKRLDKIEYDVQAVQKQMVELQIQMKVIETQVKNLDKGVDVSREDMRFYFSILIILFVAIIGLIGALIGFIIWDRRTIQKPLEKDVQTLKNDVERINQSLNLLR